LLNSLYNACPFPKTPIGWFFKEELTPNI
jgi:hypothetical protein